MRYTVKTRRMNPSNKWPSQKCQNRKNPKRSIAKMKRKKNLLSLSKSPSHNPKRNLKMKYTVRMKIQDQ